MEGVFGSAKMLKLVHQIWGIEKNWEGVHQVWRPGAMPCQSVDAQLEAAYAYADVFKKHGFQAFAQSRLD